MRENKYPRLTDCTEEERREYRRLQGILHDEEIAYNDHQIGLLINLLKRLNLYDNTLIVITSDHGNFLPKEIQRKEKGNLFDDNIHVPLIFLNPNLKSNQSIDSIAQVIDIFPTILSFTA